MISPSALFSLDVLTAWFVTFFIHSSLLILGAWLFSKWVVPRHFQLQEIAWKTAVVMGLFSASFQLGFHFSPTSLIPKSPLATINLFETSSPISSLEVPFSLEQEPVSQTIPLHETQTLPEAAGVLLEKPVETPLAKGATPSVAQTPGSTTVGFPWQQFLIWTWFLGALFLLTRFTGRLIRLHQLLADRTPITEGTLFHQLQRLRASAGFKPAVTLSISDHLRIPIAFGLINPEICVPRQAMTKLGPGQQATMLAHELAHLIHRDPHWLRLVHLMQAVLFLQPLFRLAQKQLHLLAEIRCDDWAVYNLGQPRDLAHCLTEVAGWSLNTKRHLPVPGMAKGGSILQKRVERLLNKNHRIAKSQSWILRTIIIGGLSLMAMATPGLLPAEPVVAPAAPVPLEMAQAALPAASPMPVLTPEKTAEPLAEIAASASPAAQPKPIIAAEPLSVRATAPAAHTPAISTKIASPKPVMAKRIAKAPATKSGNWGDDYDYRRHKETRELVIDAPSTLVIDGGQNGGISVKGWNRGDVKIIAKVQAYTADAEDAEALFDEIQVVADDRIYAEGPSRHSWSVSFEVFAPFQTNVDLETHNGGITLRDLSGKLEFKATNGGIHLSGLSGEVRGRTTNGGMNVILDGEQWDGRGLDVVTTNGGVTVEIPENYNAELETGTSNGRLDFQFPIMVKGEINKKIKTTMGKGGPSVRVRTTNGSVRVKH